MFFRVVIPVRSVALTACLLAALLCAGAAWSATTGKATQMPHSRLRLSEPGDAVTISVEAIGAVKWSGQVVLSPLAATVDSVIGNAGGALPDAYRFAAMILRAAPDAVAVAGQTSTPCVPLADFHATLLLRDDVVLGARAELSAKLLAGQLHRAGLQDVALGSTTASPVPALLDGDVLALPARTGTVYVVPGVGRVMRVQHEPTLRAEEYLRQVDPEESADVDRYVLLYPSGRAINLKLEPWRYEPTMVPPGSLIAPAVDCLPGE